MKWEGVIDARATEPVENEKNGRVQTHIKGNLERENYRDLFFNHFTERRGNKGVVSRDLSRP